LLVAWGARALSAAIGVLAIVGFFRYRRHHHASQRGKWTSIALLAVAPAPSAAGNAYGGEIIFRVFLFALPFMAIAAAAVFFPHRRAGASAWARLGLIATSLLLVAGFCLGNYGQEAIDYFTPSEVAASQWLYRFAPPGTQVIGADSNFPWAFSHYNAYTYTFLDSPPALGNQVRRDPVATLIALMSPAPSSPHSYLVLTRSQQEEIDLTGVWPLGVYARVVHDLLSSQDFWVVYQNRGVMVLELSPAAAAVDGRTP
jgi:hypothetical protein